MATFHTIGVIAKVGDPSADETVDRLAAHLDRAGREVLMDADTVAGGIAPGHPRLPADQLAQAVDLLIAVGGDGTMLNAARTAARHPVPVLGVNRGRLGFLVDVSPGHLDEIDAVLDGDYVADDRIALSAEIQLDGQVLSRGVALNDVVLFRWNTARMVEFDTYIDGEFCNHHRSDGMVVCTPTGSTAYAMASGGPIMHPDLEAVGLIPICPHTLSNRPLVVSAASRVEIQLHKRSVSRVRVSCDSQEDLGAVDGGSLVIERLPGKLRFVHPRSYRFLQILRAKLRWGDSSVT